MLFYRFIVHFEQEMAKRGHTVFTVSKFPPKSSKTCMFRILLLLDMSVWGNCLCLLYVGLAPYFGCITCLQNPQQTSAIHHNCTKQTMDEWSKVPFHSCFVQNINNFSLHSDRSHCSYLKFAAVFEALAWKRKLTVCAWRWGKKWGNSVHRV